MKPEQNKPGGTSDHDDPAGPGVGDFIRQADCCSQCCFKCVLPLKRKVPSQLDFICTNRQSEDGRQIKFWRQ
ncbi:hypothetical protein JQK88_34675 [Mesorhizobium caraganae]|uniref:hypothetical protein n=1 Tax=Mesorhizobium caraganae TaxID=483206 RepID=UPI0017844034|nr:hypothetical protein [Mesorhizobium caraganae]MBM2716216.1 hypothetical protein [Mesorhizobium caraganae]